MVVVVVRPDICILSLQCRGTGGGGDDAGGGGGGGDGGGEASYLYPFAPVSGY